MEVYNTLSRTKEELVGRDAGKVSIYVCGPTVYNLIHIGNARTYLSFDMMVRYLRSLGLDVTFVRNITDVEDKIINRAKEEGITTEAVAAKYTEAFEEDMGRLGAVVPDVEPKATDNIPEMVALIERLVDRGHAYEVDGDVYFEVSGFADYGKLSGRTLEDMRAGQRVEVDQRKRHPMDFALWKAAKPGEPSWPSPWGPGRPGWHIECSVMSEKYLGASFDVHGGGQDLIFPHHENEIAQSEGATGKPFVRYWLHGGMVNIGEEKMAKSVGNIILLRELADQYSANTIRMLALSTHYRSPLDFGVERLEESREKLGRLRDTLKGIEDGLVTKEQTSERAPALDEATAGAREAFRGAMDDDFNSPLAMAALYDLAGRVNVHLKKCKTASVVSLTDVRDTLTELAGVLGLGLGPDIMPVGQLLTKDELERIPVEDSVESLVEDLRAGVEEFKAATLTVGGEGPKALSEVADVIRKIVAGRELARRGKDFDLADSLRAALLEQGVILEDSSAGTRWIPPLY